MIWYRSAVVVGAVFINAAGKTELLNVETFLFTFGKGVKDAFRIEALKQVAQAVYEQVQETLGGRGVRVFIEGEDLFAPAHPSEAIGLGGYQIGVRVEDGKVLAKSYIGRRRSVRGILNKAVGAFERARAALWRVFG